MNHRTLLPLLLALALLPACQSSSSSGGDDDTDTGNGSDSDTDTDVDTDSDTDSDTDTDTDTETDTDTDTYPPMTDCDGGKYDPVTDLCWQHPADHTGQAAIIHMDGIEWIAQDYCYALDHGGSVDWHLPTIDELRSLIRGCPSTELGGECSVSDEDDCQTEDCAEECSGCEGSVDSCFWDDAMENSCSNYWSMTQVHPSNSGAAWYLSFGNAYIALDDIESSRRVMCVRFGM